MISLFQDLLGLFFPEVCPACGNVLFKGERIICTSCRLTLPMTRFSEISNNNLEKQFWGKVDIKAATSLYYFHKKGRVQHLLHRLKYHGELDAGEEVGRLLGVAIQTGKRFQKVEGIVPVPIHAKRYRSRGYNQSDPIAEGVAEILGAPVHKNLLTRVKAVQSQTAKGRFERWENAGKTFQVINSTILQHKHLLLIDDVITTGSTLSACAEALLSAGAGEVSVAAVAFAVKK